MIWLILWIIGGMFAHYMVYVLLVKRFPERGWGVDVYFLIVIGYLGGPITGIGYWIGELILRSTED